MELRWFFRALGRYWYLVAIPVVVVGGLVGYRVLTAPPTAGGGYTTVVRFSAAQSPESLPNRDGDFQDVWLSSELAVRALSEWVLTSSFKREVAARAAAQGVTFDPAQLPTAADQKRTVGQLFLSWHDAAELEVIAGAALDVLREDSQHYFPQFGGQPAQVTVLDDVQVVPAPPPLTDSFAPLVRVALAAVAGLGLAVLAAYLDPMLRTPDEIEQLGMSVLVSVPRE